MSVFPTYIRALLFETIYFISEWKAVVFQQILPRTCTISWSLVLFTPANLANAVRALLEYRVFCVRSTVVISLHFVVETNIPTLETKIPEKQVGRFSCLFLDDHDSRCCGRQHRSNSSMWSEKEQDI